MLKKEVFSEFKKLRNQAKKRNLPVWGLVSELDGGTTVKKLRLASEALGEALSKDKGEKVVVQVFIKEN